MSLFSAPILVASAVALAVLLVLILVATLASRELRRRRSEREARAGRRRDEERRRKLEAAADKPVSIGIDRREQDELLENARMLARDNPDKTAKLLRDWLRDD